MAQGIHLRKYGVEATIDFELYETDGVDLKVDAASATGDINIQRDEAASEELDADAFVDEGQSYSLVLSATEMQAARIIVHVVDQGTKAWLDKVIIVETYGHASAMHAFDLDTATVNPGANGITEATIADDAFTSAQFAANAFVSTHFTDGYFTADKFATDTDVYLATINVAVDAAAPADRYGVSWYKNGVYLASSAITNPAITVVALGGAVLVNAETMTNEADVDGTYYYDEATDRMDAGEIYAVKCTATIGGATRTMVVQHVRDTSA